MSKKVLVSIKVDQKLKEEAEAVYSALGISMSTAFNSFLEQCVQCGGIPFETTGASFNKETYIAVQDVRLNRNLSESFSSVDKVIEELKD